MGLLPIAAAASLLLAPTPALSTATLDVIPAPVSSVATGADFHLDRNTVIQTRTPAVGTLLASDLRSETGLDLAVMPNAAPASRKISLRIAGGLGDGYRLAVNRSGVEVTAT